MKSRLATSGARLALASALAVLALAITAPSHAGSAAHTYDSLGRLTQVTYSNGVVITYVYDAAGNRTSFVVTGAPS